MTTQQELDTMVTSFIDTMVWADCNDGDDDVDVCIDDVSDTAVTSITADCQRFIDAVVGLLPQYTEGFVQLGHDFYLTRCGHGVGFWDRDLGDLGEQLTTIAESFGVVDVYTVDGRVEV